MLRLTQSALHGKENRVVFQKKKHFPSNLASAAELPRVPRRAVQRTSGPSPREAPAEQRRELPAVPVQRGKNNPLEGPIIWEIPFPANMESILTPRTQRRRRRSLSKPRCQRGGTAPASSRHCVHCPVPGELLLPPFIHS